MKNDGVELSTRSAKSITRMRHPKPSVCRAYLGLSLVVPSHRHADWLCLLLGRGIEEIVEEEADEKDEEVDDECNVVCARVCVEEKK